MTNARDQIIETTCALLELQGYHATGLNQIIKESGSPKGSLYYYFPGGKDELTAESLNRVGAMVLGRIRENLAAQPDPVTAVSGFIRSIAHNVVVSGFRAGGPITTVAMETAATNDRLREVCQQIYGDWQQAFAQRLIDGGYDTARAQRLSVLIIAAIEGGIILCRTSRSDQPLHAVADEIEALLSVGR